MREELRQLVIETLRRGEDLPEEWARELFPSEKKEYELTYSGKEREVDIIAETMAVPLQSVTTFGSNGSDWSNMLIFGDNLQALKTLLEKKKAGELCNADGTPGVRLIYIDPPFSTQRDFKGGNEEKAYRDKIAGAEFIEFLRKRLVLIHDLLSDDGALYLHLDTKKSHYMKVILDEIFGEHNFQNEIIWKRQSAHNDSSKCGAIHDTILFYTKSSNYLWNIILTDPSPDYIEQFFDQVEGETGRRYARGDLTAGGLSGGGYDYTFRGIKRVWRAPKSTLESYEAEGRLHWPKSKKGVPRLKRYLDEFEGVPLQDIWTDIKVIHNRSSERVGYPTQKPETLIERVINSSSNPGDIVLDAFIGSGTTCAVAEKLERRWIGIDSGKLAIYTTQKRMLDLKTKIGNKGKPLGLKPFTVYNAGLYDFSRLKELSWSDWRFFALQLFGCKDEAHVIGGLQVDGKRKGAGVLVFNHFEHKGKRVDEQTVYDIHLAVGKKIGNHFYIIAPRAVFDFQQDYLVFDNVRYYALRIPYSFINELHHREFTALQQPNDETAVNAIVDAVGFDFIRPPKVEWTTGIGKRGNTLIEEAYIRIDKFESRAYIRGKDTRGGIETLSMVLIDYDYDDVFNPDIHFFADQLNEKSQQLWFPQEEFGEQIMVVFMDIYGNEARQVILQSEFDTEEKTVVKNKEQK